MNRDVRWAVAALATAVAPALAATTVEMHAIDAQGIGEKIGAVTAEDGDKGLVLAVRLEGLQPGEHGFHVHENPTCEPAEEKGEPMAGLAAGGHYDPQGTGRHEGPFGNGHLGDLPAIHAGPDGNVDTKVIAPRLELADIQGRSLMVHRGGDNYADQPKPLGGGGARVACGVVE